MSANMGLSSSAKLTTQQALQNCLPITSNAPVFILTDNERPQIGSSLLRLWNKAHLQPISEYLFAHTITKQAQKNYAAHHIAFSVNDYFLYHVDIKLQHIKSHTTSHLIAFSLSLVDFGKNTLNDTQDGLCFIKSEDAQLNQLTHSKKRPTIIFYLDNQSNVLFYHLSYDPPQSDGNTFMGVFFRMIKEPFLYAILKRNAKRNQA